MSWGKVKSSLFRIQPLSRWSRSFLLFGLLCQGVKVKGDLVWISITWGNFPAFRRYLSKPFVPVLPTPKPQESKLKGLQQNTSLTAHCSSVCHIDKLTRICKSSNSHRSTGWRPEGQRVLLTSSHPAKGTSLQESMTYSQDQMSRYELRDLWKLFGQECLAPLQTRLGKQKLSLHWPPLIICISLLGWP